MVCYDQMTGTESGPPRECSANRIVCSRIAFDACLNMITQTLPFSSNWLPAVGLLAMIAAPVPLRWRRTSWPPAPVFAVEQPPGDADSSRSLRTDRSPVDLAMTPDGRWIVTANQISDSVSLIRLADRRGRG